MSRQRDHTAVLIATAGANGQFRLVDNHRRAAEHLGNIITALEAMTERDRVSSDAAERLADAARRRSQSAHSRARDAIRFLDRAGHPVRFAAVAQAASMSRAWLYRVPELRAEIERLRTGQRRQATRFPSGQRSSADSLRCRIEAQIDANRVAPGREPLAQRPTGVGPRRGPVTSRS